MGNSLDISVVTFLVLLLGWLLATLFLAVRLIISGMGRTYPLLLLFLVSDFLQNFIFLRYATQHYEYLQISQAVEIFIAGLLVRDLCYRSFADHPAIAQFVKNSVIYVVALCLLVSGISLYLSPVLPTGRSPALHQTVGLEGAAMSGLFVFVMTVSLVLAWFPVRVRRNVASIFIGFGLYFGTQWGISFVTNLDPAITGWMNATGLMVSFIIVMGWWATIDVEGEQAVTVTGHRWNPAAFEHLTRQLDGINRSLEGAR